VVLNRDSALLGSSHGRSGPIVRAGQRGARAKQVMYEEGSVLAWDRSTVGHEGDESREMRGESYILRLLIFRVSIFLNALHFFSATNTRSSSLFRSLSIYSTLNKYFKPPTPCTPTIDIISYNQLPYTQRSICVSNVSTFTQPRSRAITTFQNTINETLLFLAPHNSYLGQHPSKQLVQTSI
jgi:hypothetical protein